MRLPEGFSRVRYIESTGTQYLNTGFAPSGEKMRVVVDFEMTEDGNSPTMYGVFNTREGYQYLQMYEVLDGAGRYRFSWFVADQKSKSPWQDGAGYETMVGKRFASDLTMDNGTYSINIGELIQNGSYSGTVQTGLSLFLFARNLRGTADYFASMRLYSCQIYDGDTLVRDFIPVRSRLSNLTISPTIGLYDAVSGELYTNAGSGSFVAGPTVMPEPLITDRTEADLLAGNEKAHYNAADLNRVEAATGYLAGRLRDIPLELAAYAQEREAAWDSLFEVPWDPAGLPLTVKTAWDQQGIPNTVEMGRYLSNVAAVKAVTDAIPHMTFLEYIESTGTQCVDTGLLLTGESFRAEFDFQITNVSGSKSHGYFGCGVSGASLDVFQNSRNAIVVIVGGKNVTVMNATPARIFMTLEAGGTTCRCNITNEYGQTASISQVYTTIVNPHTVMVGSDHYNGRVDPCYMRIYSCKIWQGGELVRDYTPCKGEDGTVGLWEQVGGSIYKNAGTGVFLAGPEAAPSVGNSDPVELPETMDRLTIHGANAIEAALEQADAEITAVEESRTARIDNTIWFTAGETTAGEG